MRFIEFHGWEDHTVTFLLDYAILIRPADNKRHTEVTLGHGEKLILEIDYAGFMANAFSDLHDEKEYQLIPIYYTDPEAVESPLT